MNLVGEANVMPTSNEAIHLRENSPAKPAMSIGLRFLHSSITTVNLPAVGTYRNEKQMSPSFLSCKEIGIRSGKVALLDSLYIGHFAR